MPAASRAPQTDLVVSTVARDTVDLAMLASVVSLYEDERTRQMLRRFITYQSGPHLSVARTQIARMFLDDPGANWLLQVDSDMAFTPDDILALYRAADPMAAPIVGATYMGHTSADGPAREWIETSDGHVAAPLQPVEAIGAGLLLVHRSVFELLRQRDGGPLPWFEELIVGGTPVAEDWVFCLRCRSAGLPVFAHRGVRPGHLKRVPIYAAAAEQLA